VVAANKHPAAVTRIHNAFTICPRQGKTVSRDYRPLSIVSALPEEGPVITAVFVPATVRKWPEDSESIPSTVQVYPVGSW
ncbi:MAG: hypothetical protein LBB68_10195, partial [Treponema sp.]|nr:hypothetical protein [Treponema sp.]